MPGRHAIVLLVYIPHGYPTTDAPIAEVYESLGLTNIQRAIFARSNGQVCLYEWIEKVRDTYANDVLKAAEVEAEANGSDNDDICLDAVNYNFYTQLPRVRNAHLARTVEREAIIAPKMSIVLQFLIGKALSLRMRVLSSALRLCALSLLSYWTIAKFSEQFKTCWRIELSARLP